MFWYGNLAAKYKQEKFYSTNPVNCGSSPVHNRSTADSKTGWVCDPQAPQWGHKVKATRWLMLMSSEVA